MFTVINHTNHPTWTPKNRLLNRKNGAYTYSEMICKYYVPVFKEKYDKDKRKVLLLTVENDWNSPKWNEYDLIYVFVHEWDSRGILGLDLKKCQSFQDAHKNSKVVFIVNYEKQAIELQDSYLRSFWLPMAIDTEEFRKYRLVEKSPRYDKKIIYYGNIINNKVQPHQLLCRLARHNGYIVDTISQNHFNNSMQLSQEQVRDVISKYKYGVGVGRCAQELSAMGLKTLVFGYKYAHICVNSRKVHETIADNCCGRREGDELSYAFRILDQILPFHQDCRDVARILKDNLIY